MYFFEKFYVSNIGNRGKILNKHRDKDQRILYTQVDRILIHCTYIWYPEVSSNKERNKVNNNTCLHFEKNSGTASTKRP